MKQPEEIKKGLEQCANTETCENCGYRDECMDLCSNKPVTKDTLAYITQLESRLAQVERERDAAVGDIRNAKWCLCQVCDNYFKPDKAVRHYECKVLGKFSDIFAPSEFSEDDNQISMCGKFKWRGVSAENKEDKE